MIKYQSSALTATGDTVKTLIDTITLPAKAKAIVGVAVYAYAGATITTAEPVTGILTLESDDVNLQPMIIPLEGFSILGTAAGVSIPSKVWPLNVNVKGGERINCYVTMDMAMTAGLKARVTLVLDVGD